MSFSASGQIAPIGRSISQLRCAIETCAFNMSEKYVLRKVVTPDRGLRTDVLTRKPVDRHPSEISINQVSLAESSCKL